MPHFLKNLHIGLLALLLGACASVPLEDTAEQRKQLAAEVVAIVLDNGGYAVFKEQTVAQYFKELSEQVENVTGRPLSREYRRAYINAFQVAFDETYPQSLWAAEMITFYSTRYDRSELAELLKLYSTPNAQKILRSSHVFAGASWKIGSDAVWSKRGIYAQVFQLKLEENTP